ncbi:mucin TcMUCII, putative [Trypanosoma cruzi marinkellei]|uniref:Mucin TcMUCII, putative n=1 Tax=Trypanosoma cruzi marinkellei TaxID=85056 RepID=K2NJX9_TRYCR|nr:mucin TcMUCII, putative [Trypanosoma cruzi marinkellei]
MMTTCRLLCALLVLALCCYPSVCVAEGDSPEAESLDQSPGKTEEGVVPHPANTSTTPSAKGPADPLPAPGETADTQVIPGSGTVTVQTIGGNGNTGSRGMTFTVGSEGQGGAMPETSGNSVVQPNGAPNLEEAPGSPETVQEPTEITGTVGSRSESASSKEHKETEEKQSEGSGRENVTSQGPDTPSPESVTKEEPSGSGGSTSGSANPMAQIRTNGTVTVQIQEENVPNTTTTTVPEAPSTTTTEAPTTTTTGAPSRLPEIDGSLSSSAWVCAPLLLAVSALAYTALG